MRKRSKSKATIDKADKALQNAHRRRYKDKLCESCLREFYCMHHHLPKSRSNAGRYHKDNLIFLCKPCHDEISFNGGSQVIARYSARKGKRWIDRMDELARERKSYYSKGELEKIISYYEKWQFTKSKSMDSEILF